MTKNKRFWSEDDCVGYYTEIVDNDKELADVPNPKKNLTIEEAVDLLNELNNENEQLRQDNNNLIHLLENQSVIIHELHSELMDYQLKEPIILTKEDLEIMGKAISYYTYGRYAE